MTERWTDEKLDRFANTIAESYQQSNERLTQLEQLQAQATDERQELREVFSATMQVISESAQTQAEMLKAISEMQSEVRGLQVENRRILDRVFGSES